MLSRHDLHEISDMMIPFVEQPARNCTSGVLMMPHQQRVNPCYLIVLIERMQFDHTHVAPGRETTIFVQHVRQPTTHAGGEIASGFAEHHDQSARHILTSVVADPFDDGSRAAVAYSEPLAGDAAEESFAAGRTIQCDVADNNVLFGLEGCLACWAHCHEAAGEPFAAVIVGVAF